MQTRQVVCVVAVAFTLAIAPRAVQSQDEPTATPSAREEFASDAAESRVLLPIVNVSGTLVDAVAVRGRLTHNNAPLSETPFLLQTCPDNPAEPPLRLPATTDALGNYAVRMPLGEHAGIAVALLYPAAPNPPVRGTLSSFQSVCIYNDNVTVRMPSIELAELTLTSPGKGSPIDMPILFAWTSRSHPASNEMYQLLGEVQYNCSGCTPVSISAAALPHPSSSIMLDCVYAPVGARGDIVSGDFRLMLANDVGVGYSENYHVEVGETVRCAGR